MIIFEKPITDLPSLLDAVLDVNNRFDSQVWWRGQNNFNWKLEPSVFRKKNGGVFYEQNIITRFRQRAPSRYPNTPPLDDICMGGYFSCNIIACQPVY